MDNRQRVGGAVFGVVVLFLAVQLGALALVEPFKSAGFQTVENPQNPVNSLVYVGVLLVATGLILLVIKLGREQVLRAFILFTSGLIASYVFTVVLPPIAVSGVNVAPILGGVLIVAGLVVYPEWWVIDIAGVVMGMGAAGLFGISFGVLPAIVLLSVLAVYDAISVYGTEHMLTLASGVMELKVPVLLVVPVTLDYSFIKQAEAESERTAAGGEQVEETAGEGHAEMEATEREEGAEPEGFQRDALFIGLGDAVMPSILVASAAFFLDTPRVLGIELAALTAMIGTIVGLLVLLRMVLKGRAHAGLPLLNGGAILGYLVGALAGGVPLVEALGLAPYL